MLNEVIKLVKSKKYYEDLYEIPWVLKEGVKLTNPKKFSNLQKF